MQSVIFAVILTVVVSIPGFIYAAELLKLMGAGNRGGQRRSGLYPYHNWGSLIYHAAFLLNGIFRGAGDAMMAMKSLWLANACNIILCPLLIRGWGLFRLLV